MSIFDFFATGKERSTKDLSDEDRRWNRMWDLWVAGKAESPYAELMEYESEVNNGGHSQYFFNVANCGDLKASAELLLTILPEPLCANFQKAYEAFSAQEDICDDDNWELFETCDTFFYNNEKLLLDLLKHYADRIP